MSLPAELIAAPCDPKMYLALRPTLIGVVMGVCFYEHPTGDEAPLIMVSADGTEAAHSICYELPYFDMGEWHT